MAISHACFGPLPREKKELREISRVLNQAFCRRGLAYEATRALMEFGVDAIMLHIICAETISPEKSTPLMKKTGIQEEAYSAGTWRHLTAAGLIYIGTPHLHHRMNLMFFPAAGLILPSLGILILCFEIVEDLMISFGGRNANLALPAERKPGKLWNHTFHHNLLLYRLCHQRVQGLEKTSVPPCPLVKG